MSLDSAFAFTEAIAGGKEQGEKTERKKKERYTRFYELGCALNRHGLIRVYVQQRPKSVAGTFSPRCHTSRRDVAIVHNSWTALALAAAPLLPLLMTYPQRHKCLTYQVAHKAQ